MALEIKVNLSITIAPYRDIEEIFDWIKEQTIKYSRIEFFVEIQNIRLLNYVCMKRKPCYILYNFCENPIIW